MPIVSRFASRSSRPPRSPRAACAPRPPRARPLSLALAALLSCSLAAVALPAQAPAPTGAEARAAARKWREGNEGRIVREFAELLSKPNVASNLADVRANAEFLRGWLQARGASPQLLEVPNAPPAVYGELRVPGATKTLVLYAHYDGQPVDRSQWQGGNPWSPILRTGVLGATGVRDVALTALGARVDGSWRLYARSAGDDKASIMAMLTALDALRAANMAPSVNLKFFFEGEEEAGSGHLAAILRKYKDLLQGDAWLFCDGPVSQTGRQQVVFGDRGIIGLGLTIYGPAHALHSGHYGNWAPNPGALLVNLIASMRDDDGRILIPHYYDDVRPISAAEQKAIDALPPVDSMLRASLQLARTEANDALLASRIMLPALNVRGLQVGAVGSKAANVISTQAQASLGFRLVPNQTPEHVKELVEAHITARGYHIVHQVPDSATRTRYPRVALLQWESGYPPQRTALDAPFGQALIAAVSSGAAEPPLVVPTSGGSGPTYLFTQILGAPVVNLPIANYDDNQHAANENLRLQNLYDGIELYAALMTQIGKEWKGVVVP